MDDYYKILGITKTATEEDVKKAYRRLAHKYHPDKSGGDEKMFKKINEAYQILSNREKRAQYDRFGRVFSGGGGGSSEGPFGGFGGGQNPFGFEFNFDPSQFDGFGGDLGEMMDSIFEGIGLKRKRRTYRRGSDLEIAQEITLEEAYRGVKKALHFRTLVACAECNAVGHFPKEGFTTCAVCNGRGEVREARNSYFGTIDQVRACAKCFGTGQIPNKICLKCAGTGRARGEKNVEIEIASGVEDQQIIQVPKAGEVGERGADAGDLYVRIRVKPHPVFVREGADLVLRHSVTITTLLLDREVEIKGIGGETITAKVPTDFKLGDRLVVEGAGMPRLGSFGRGRLLVELDVKLPKKLSDRAKKLFEDLRKEME